jgi:hypothetical protein
MDVHIQMFMDVKWVGFHPLSFFKTKFRGSNLRLVKDAGSKLDSFGKNRQTWSSDGEKFRMRNLNRDRIEDLPKTSNNGLTSAAKLDLRGLDLNKNGRT